VSPWCDQEITTVSSPFNATVSPPHGAACVIEVTSRLMGRALFHHFIQ